MAKKIGWGLIGLGSIAKGAHLPAINKSDNSKLIAVCSREESKAKDWAKRFGAKKAYSDYLMMVADPEIDVIDITTPNSLHCEETVVAAEHGKNVFCGKPMAPTVKECEEMIAACDRNHVKLMVGYMLRFKPHHIMILEMMKAGELGTVFLGRAQFHEWVPDESDTYLKDVKLCGELPALQDVGVHSIDTLRFLMGEVVEVMSYSDKLVFKYADTVSLLLMKLENSAYAFVDCSFCTRYTSRPQKLEIYGTKGSVFAATLGGGEFGGKLETSTSVGWTIHEVPEENHYLKEITHFSDCILRDVKPAIDGEEGLKTQRVVAAALESHKTGRKIRLSEVH